MKTKPPSLRKIEGEVFKLIEKVRKERKESNLMYKLKETIKKLFSSKTPYGRVIRTFVQSFIGVSAALLFVLADPTVYRIVSEQNIFIQFGGISAVVTAVAAIQNYSKKFWDWIKDF